MPDLGVEVQRLRAEVRELEMLAEQSQSEISRLQQREDAARARYQAAKLGGAAEVGVAADELLTALGRRMTMEAQLAALQAKRKLLDRVVALLEAAERQAGAAPRPGPAVEEPPAPAPPRLDESRLLQAVVDTQEEERRRIARQVHDGPAQAMANVVLQAEISERLYDSDPARSRVELAALRQMVNRTLQQLRGFIFELRPMILDDLGLVPTLRRYVQTMIEAHGIRLAYSSVGRDRRVPTEAEVAIFRLIQDSLIERIERAGATDLSLTTTWRDEALEITLHSDGRELPDDGELSSGLRRSERLQLLGGASRLEVRADGTSILNVAIPIRGGSQMIS